MLRLAQIEKLSLFTFVVSSMLAVGLSLGLKSQLSPLRDVRFVLVALSLNFILAPALAWMLTVGAEFVPVAGNFRDPSVPVMLTASAVVGLLLSALATRWMQHQTPLLPV
jgi:predicted Na+-dependent transporter